MSATLHIDLVDKVNRRLPEAEQFEELFWGYLTTQRLFPEYRRLYPDGPLSRRRRILIAAGLFCLLIVAWSMGFFN